LNRCPEIIRGISMMLAFTTVSLGRSVANDQPLIGLELRKQDASLQSTISPTTISIRDFGLQFAGLSRAFQTSRIDFPRKPRVSRSHRPFRQLTLTGGDRVVGEVLGWGSQMAEFRLQDGQVVSVPVAAVSRLENSPGEVDVLDESFDADSLAMTEPKFRQMHDHTESADGTSSLRIDSSSQGFRQILEPPLATGRIEFSFRVANNDPSSACGEWQIEWGGSEDSGPPLIVRVGSDHRISTRPISTTEKLAGSTSQVLKLSDGWHSFIALITPDRTRLIVDEALLDSRATPKALLTAIQFRPAANGSKNVLWIDELQIRKIGNPEQGAALTDMSLDRDTLVTESGDELSGKIIGVTTTSATLETLGKIRSIPLHRLTALNWFQRSTVLRQFNPQKAGVVARIEMQPFIDRPECEPERLTVTIVSINSRHLIVQHSMIGELKIGWSDVLRIQPLFFGQTVLVDARQFHLGNSLRTDFHRHLPDGTQFKGEFELPSIPSEHPYFSLDVAELEAAGPDAPRGSPFLAELRAGNLVTDVFVNDQNIGNLNQQIRFKAKIENPDRVRIAIPADVLKRGPNTFELREQPLKKNGREFDDAEVGNIRIDFES
jgi:hypothetical protein